MSLVLQNIVHRFAGTAAVNGASLEVAAGEIVCLFGPSGCGKTTLLRIAAGLERLQSGLVALDGDALAGEGADRPAERRPVGFVFQDYVLFPHLTALGNVAFGIEGEKGRSRRLQAAEELRRVGLDGFEKRYPHELSGGQQQRVALARAFARRPRAMLLDEPFASIDAVLRRRLREDVRRMLKSAGAATILVTHDAEEALALGDRVAIMRAGRIVEAASPQDLFDRPATPDGALMFAGAQRVDGAVSGGTANTAFGAFALPGLPEGAVAIVIQAGGARLVPDSAGPAEVIESRFAGPDWTVYLSGGEATGLALASARPFGAGERVRLDLDPALVRVFPAG